MDPEARPISNPGRGYLLLVLGVVTGSLGAFGTAHWLSSRPLPATSPAVLNIGDGTGLTGAEILVAAAVLSRERAVEIKFSVKGGAAGSVSTIPGKIVENMPCDWLYLGLMNSKYVVNDEVLSFETLQERIELFAHSARLTQSTPFLLLACDENTSSTHLIEVLSILSERGVEIVLYPASFDWLFEPAVAKPAPPQIEPQSHPVEFP